MRRRFETLSLGTFVILGLPDGALGTAWPAIRHSFGVPIGDLGLILLVNTLGSIAISPWVGRLMQRFGVVALMMLAAACAAVAAIAVALAPGLWLLFLAGPLVGMAAGAIDGGLNTAFALSGRTRLLNLLHAFYGVGTALGTAIVTVAILLGSWRWSFGVLGATDLLTAGAWVGLQRRASHGATVAGAGPGERAGAGTVRRERGMTSEARAEAPGAQQDPSWGWSRVRLTVALGLGLASFFLYVGLEVSAGQWETSFGRGHLGLSAATAGAATFGYWAALTAVRMLLALPAFRRVRPRIIVRWGAVLSALGAALVWWAPLPGLAVAGFLVLGAASAGVFPALVALTPGRIGAARSEHVIAWQVGAGAGGGAALSALIGVLINGSGLTVLGPSLVVLAAGLLLTTLVLDRVAPAA